MPGIVSDTSALRYLYQLNRLELLRQCFGEIHVPTAVTDELQAGERAGVRVPVLSRLHWCSIHAESSAQAAPSPINLGRGELAAIRLASQLGLPVLLDDLAARRFATGLGLSITGTIGVILLARERGLIPQASTELDQLRHLGFRMSAQAMQRALELAGEL